MHCVYARHSCHPHSLKPEYHTAGCIKCRQLLTINIRNNDREPAGHVCGRTQLDRYYCVPAVYCAAMPHGTYQRMQQTQSSSSSSSDNYHSAIIHPPAPLVIAISIHCRSRSSSISWDIIPFARMPPNETNECPSRTPPAGRLGNGRSITGARCHPSA